MDRLVINVNEKYEDDFPMIEFDKSIMESIEEDGSRGIDKREEGRNTENWRSNNNPMYGCCTVAHIEDTALDIGHGFISEPEIKVGI